MSGYKSKSGFSSRFTDIVGNIFAFKSVAKLTATVSKANKHYNFIMLINIIMNQKQLYTVCL